MNQTLADKVKSRKTFAIISHPDAGKTTITEQLLLFGGAIRQAGTVKGKKSGKIRQIRLDGNRKTKRDLRNQFCYAGGLRRLPNQYFGYTGS